MSSRYATIITDEDGREVVSSIGEFESGVPDVRVGRVERVPPGVLIGMVRSGLVDAAGDFGFPAGAPGGNGRAVGIAAANPNERPRTQAAALSAPPSAGGESEPGKPSLARPAQAKPAKPGRAPKPQAKRKSTKRLRTVRSAGSGHG